MVYLFVGLGGIAGSLLRYFFSQMALHMWGKDFPAGTLIINLSGSFFLGWVASKFVIPKKLHPNLLAALTTGVIGSYTTFSTFCLEAVHLMEGNQYLFAFLYMMISLDGGLILIRLGMWMGSKGVKEAGQSS